jgi:hypothetical protein
MGHEPNDQREVKKINVPFTSKLKRCMHTNKDEENPNRKFQGGLKPKPKLVEDKGKKG